MLAGNVSFPSQLLPFPPPNKSSSRPKATHSAAAVERALSFRPCRCLSFSPTQKCHLGCLSFSPPQKCPPERSCSRTCEQRSRRTCVAVARPPTSPTPPGRPILRAFCEGLETYPSLASPCLPFPPPNKSSSRPKAAHSAAAVKRPPHFSLALALTCLFVCHPAGICFCRCLFLPVLARSCPWMPLPVLALGIKRGASAPRKKATPKAHRSAEGRSAARRRNDQILPLPVLAIPPGPNRPGASSIAHFAMGGNVPSSQPALAVAFASQPQQTIRHLDRRRRTLPPQ